MHPKLFTVSLVLASVFLGGCGTNNSVKLNEKTVAVDESLFITKNLVKEITRKDWVLSESTKTQCYKISVKAEPQEHKMGPWCPEGVEDTEEKGAIWFTDGKIYDVSMGQRNPERVNLKTGIVNYLHSR